MPITLFLCILINTCNLNLHFDQLPNDLVTLLQRFVLQSNFHRFKFSSSLDFAQTSLYTCQTCLIHLICCFKKWLCFDHSMSCMTSLGERHWILKLNESFCFCFAGMLLVAPQVQCQILVMGSPTLCLSMRALQCHILL